MTDDQLRRWLEEADQPLQPAPEYAAGLRDELRAELGFVPRLAASARDAGAGRTRVGIRRGPAGLLFVAALFVVASLIAGAGAVTVLQRSIARPVDLLTVIEQTGRIRIAVRPDHPQFAVRGQPAAGFDIDVAQALAERLGVRPDIVVMSVVQILAGSGSDSWDVALPSTAIWNIDPGRFLISSPYYRWVHRVVVGERSTAAASSDLAGERFCAVSGDGGEAWLQGHYPSTVAPPAASEIVSRTSDDECLALLQTGAVDAVVTARLSDADLAVRPGIRVLTGPDPEPRAVIVARGSPTVSDPHNLLDAINRALDELTSDGTLTRLSQSRFGGADLSAP
jgi:cystine transport system substrate-binding protein